MDNKLIIILRRLGVCIIIVLSVSSCSTPRTATFLLPKRLLEFTIYTDGTCEYSFNGMRSGKRTNQKWRRYGGIEENLGLNIICRNELVKEGGEFTKSSPEIWPNVNIRLMKMFDLSQKNDDGNIVFQPEPQKNHYGHGWAKTIAKKNGFGYSAWVSVGPGTKDNEAALPIKEIERYPCETQFSSDKSNSNIGYLYSDEHQASTGIYIHVSTIVIAQKYAPGIPC